MDIIDNFMINLQFQFNFFRDLLGFLIGILLNLYNVLFSLVPGMFWKNISLPSRDEEIAVNPKGVKATVCVISNDLPFIEWNVRFTTIPFEPLLGQGLLKYSYLYSRILSAKKQCKCTLAPWALE